MPYPPHRRRAHLTGILSLVTVALAGCSLLSPERASETRTLTHAMESAPSMLTIVARDGTIEVQSDPSLKEISITATVTAGGKTVEEAKQRLTETKIDVTEPSAGEVSIGATWPGTSTDADEISFTVRLPKIQGVNARSSNGRIAVSDAEGPITIATSNGRVTVSGSKQDLDITTSNGSVDVTDHVGDVQVNTSNGSVELINLTGGVSVRTSNSRVTVSLSNESTQPVNVTTSNDVINLTCGTAWNGEIRATTSNDGVQVESAAGRVTKQSLTEDSGELTVGTGGSTSRLETSNDQIRINIR